MNIKSIANKMFYYCGAVLYPDAKEDIQLFSARAILKYGIVQKIMGFNRRVSWPVHWSSEITAPHKIVRGTRFPGMSAWCHLDGRNGIIFGENVWVGPKVSIISMNHSENDYLKYVEEVPIRIGSNSWLATGAVILPGVELGEHTIVAAGAVVTKSFPDPNQLLGGVPARVIRKLGDYEVSE